MKEQNELLELYRRIEPLDKEGNYLLWKLKAKIDKYEKLEYEAVKEVHAIYEATINAMTEKINRLEKEVQDLMQPRQLTNEDKKIILNDFMRR